MINAKELRVGSKFLSAFDNIETIISIIDNTDNGKIQFVSDEHKAQYSHLILCEENRNQYKPIEIKGIPLTEYWLKKFGFEKGAHNYFNSHIKAYVSGSYCHIKLIGHDDELARIQYVHQLQNLYFALTGEELTIKT